MLEIFSRGISILSLTHQSQCPTGSFHINTHGSSGQKLGSVEDKIWGKKNADICVFKRNQVPSDWI